MKTTTPSEPPGGQPRGIAADGTFRNPVPIGSHDTIACHDLQALAAAYSWAASSLGAAYRALMAGDFLACYNLLGCAECALCIAGEEVAT